MPGPIAGVAITLKVAISVTAMILLPQTENSILFFMSIARPDGFFARQMERAAITAGLAASISAISFVSSRLT